MSPPPVPADVSFLRGTSLVLSRELRAWFDGGLGKVALVAGLFVVATLLAGGLVSADRPDARPFFDGLPFALAIFAPALATLAWTEELRARTFELWTSLPLEPAQLSLAKYGASLALYGVSLLASLPVALASGGADGLGTGYLAAALLGALFLAIGQLLYAKIGHPIRAFLATAFLCALLLATGEPRFFGTFVARWISALPRYDALVRGDLAVPALYFLGLTAVCLAWISAADARPRISP